MENQRRGDDYYQVDILKKESLENHFMKSLLTIVADSAKVEVWFIDKVGLNNAMVDTP